MVGSVSMQVTKTLQVAVLAVCGACGPGATSAPAQVSPSMEPIATADPVVVTAVETPPGPVLLSKKLNPYDHVTAECLAVNGVCDDSSIYLAIDGLRFDLLPTRGTPNAPFGSWNRIRSDTRAGAWVLSLVHEESFETLHLELTGEGKTVGLKESVVRPRVLVGQLADDTPSAIKTHFRCQALEDEAGGQPDECTDLAFYRDDKMVIKVEDSHWYKPSTFKLRHLNKGKSNAAIMLSAMFGESEDSWLLAPHEDSSVPVWHGRGVKFDKKEGWSTTDTSCVREWTSKRRGKQAFLTTRYRWDGNVITKTSKHWTEVSGCSASGREGIGSRPLWGPGSK